jgi:hypothetical protein
MGSSYATLDELKAMMSGPLSIYKPEDVKSLYCLMDYEKLEIIE